MLKNVFNPLTGRGPPLDIYKFINYRYVEIMVCKCLSIYGNLLGIFSTGG